MRQWTTLTMCLAVSLGIAGSSGLYAPPVTAAERTVKTVGPNRMLLKRSRQRAINYLRNAQADDGSWTAPQATGITALVVTAVIRSGLSADDPMVAKGLKHLESFIQKDGGIYFSKSNHRNYETCISLLAFHAANKNGRYTKTIAHAETFLRKLQWDEDEGLNRSDTGYGGAGYGGHKRPDLSNTQFLIEALKTAGVKANDPAMKKALFFVSRAQNLETEHNTTKFAAKVNDGGFYYTPAAGGTSQAGLTPNGGLRSYGSMTYAGLKSMIYAGLTPKDRRVKAAFDWIRRFYTVSENPGLGQQGLYYYYHTFAKALSALKVDRLVDADGKQHDWRRELAEKLAALQTDSGAWVNKASRWYEGDPNLATAYALMALSYCEPKPVAPRTTSKK